VIETSPSTPARVDVVLPCLDEAEALPWVLDRIPAGWRAIVVDNGSTDGSADLAGDLGAYVVQEPRRGFGAACHAGLTAATADIVCFIDCDASLDPAMLPAVTGPLLDVGRPGAGPTATHHFGRLAGARTPGQP
jgi:glycosyltransferase involved in cell wall biosynthesis